MNFLKKLGSGVFNVVGAALPFLPLIASTLSAAGHGKAAAVVSGSGDRLIALQDSIVTAEQMFAAAYGPDAKKGSDKLNAVRPFALALLQSLPLVADKGKPKDPEAAKAATDKVISGLADFLSAYGD